MITQKTFYNITLRYMIVFAILSLSALYAHAESPDHGDTYITATAISAIPSTTLGEISSSADVDYFSFSATSGTNYTFEAKLQTITDLSVYLFDSDGTSLLKYDTTTDGDDSSTLGWTCPADGTYYLKIDGTTSNHYIGIYAVIINTDDHGNDKSSATSIEVTETANGEIENLDDEDWFSFSAIADVDYVISASRKTVSNLYLYLYDTNGTTVIDSDIGGGAGTLAWTCTKSGTYYIMLNGGSGTGTYSLTVTGDQHGDDYTTATRVSVGSSTSGIIGNEYDIDFFSFAATLGTAYTITATLNTLDSLRITVYDANGTTELISGDTVSGDGIVALTPQSTGTYYFKIVGLNSSIGSYSVKVSDGSSGGGGGGGGCFIASASYSDDGSTLERIINRLIELYDAF